jgi:hypothetical protein
MLKHSFLLLIILNAYLSFAQKPLSDYTISELEIEKEKAIKNENLEKAAIYRKAILLKIEINNLTEKDDYVIQNCDSKTSQYDMTDIYTSHSISWFGIDFSLFKLSDVKLIGRESELIKYIPAWQKVYGEGVPLSSLKRWLRKSEFHDYRNIGQEMHHQYKDQEWITENDHFINEDMMKSHLKNYPNVSSGIGLVFMVENLNKKNRIMSGYFVWFDVSTKQLLQAKKVFGKPSAGGMSSYWGKSFIPATRNYIDWVYKKEKAKYL